MHLNNVPTGLVEEMYTIAANISWLTQNEWNIKDLCLTNDGGQYIGRAVHGIPEMEVRSRQPTLLQVTNELVAKAVNQFRVKG